MARGGEEKVQMGVKRKELLEVPKRDWKQILHGVSGVYVIPSGRKHESGYACMDFVATFQKKKEKVRFGGGCDDVSFMGTHFRMDCDWPSRIIHIWNSHGTFSVSTDISSIDFVEEIGGWIE